MKVGALEVYTKTLPDKTWEVSQIEDARLYVRRVVPEVVWTGRPTRTDYSKYSRVTLPSYTIQEPTNSPGLESLIEYYPPPYPLYWDSVWHLIITYQKDGCLGVGREGRPSNPLRTRCQHLRTHRLVGWSLRWSSLPPHPHPGLVP